MRTRSLIRALALAGALLAVVSAPATAQMAIAQKVLADFATDGVIDPCKHTSEELRLVLKHIPPDFEQYAPDYPAAVQAALEARARGECAGEKPQQPAGIDVTPSAMATPAPTATPAPAATEVPMKTVVPEPPEPEKIEIASSAAATPSAKPDRAIERLATARAANPAPAPVLLLALLAGLLLLAAVFLLAMRRLGWEQGPLAHSWREASYRSNGLWEDFRDWLRVGR